MGHFSTVTDPSAAPNISVSQSSPTFSIPSPRQFDHLHNPRPAAIRNESELSLHSNAVPNVKGISDDFLERYDPRNAGNLAAAAKQAETATKIGYSASNGLSDSSTLSHNNNYNDHAIPDAGFPFGHPEVPHRHLQRSPRPKEHIEKTRFSQDLSKVIDARQNLSEPALTDSGYDTGHTSTDSSSFMPLQDISFRIQPDELEPIVEDNQRSFDLVAPPNPTGDSNVFSLEKRSEQLFSRDHLQAIFDEPLLLSKFTSFISLKRPQSLPYLSYYLETQKALRAIKYANALVDALRPKSDFIQNKPQDTVNASLEDSMEEAFQMMVREDLPAYVAHIFIQVASSSIHKRITGTLSSHLQEVSEGLAEVFCLTDPSRPDNPIIFASEEFHWTTQYGVNHAIGRNCRFLQGPKTNLHSVRRLREAVAAGKEHSEALLNYRRDGSPFMNLLMIAPLVDSRGNTRYHIGAQVDVSGLVRDCTDLHGLQNMLLKLEGSEEVTKEDKDEFQDLCEMFDDRELNAVRKFGGHMHKGHLESTIEASNGLHRPRLLLKEPSPERGTKNSLPDLKSFGNLEGIYKHYLLIRPFPALRILFTSPSLRVPGIQQSSFLDRIGGSSRVRDELEAALSEGRGVTAKIRWLTRGDSDTGGQPRWIHCTPLQGPNGKVGIWMIILVDEANTAARSFKRAPPVASNAIIRETSGVADGKGLPATGLANTKTLNLDSTRSTARSSATASGPGTAITTDMMRSDSAKFADPSRNRSKTITPNAERGGTSSPANSLNGHRLPNGVSGPGHESPQQYVRQRQNGSFSNDHSYPRPEPHVRSNQYEHLLQHRQEPNGHPQQSYSQLEHEDAAHRQGGVNVNVALHGTATAYVPPEKQSRFAHYLDLDFNEVKTTDSSRPVTARPNGNGHLNGGSGTSTPDNYNLDL